MRYSSFVISLFCFLLRFGLRVPLSSAEWQSLIGMRLRDSIALRSDLSESLKPFRALPVSH